MKRFQSWVFLGTRLATCSAMTIPASHDAWVLLNVVMKIEPPGLRVSTQAFKNDFWSTTCSRTSLATTASYFSAFDFEWFSIVSQVKSMSTFPMWSRAVASNSSDGSKAVTFAFNLHRASVKMPAPHPTSRILIPSKTFVLFIFVSWIAPVEINPPRISGTLRLL